MNILQNEKKKHWQYIALPYMRVEEWGSSPLECMWTPELRSICRRLFVGATLKGKKESTLFSAH